MFFEIFPMVTYSVVQNFAPPLNFSWAGRCSSLKKPLRRPLNSELRSLREWGWCPKNFFFKGKNFFTGVWTSKKVLKWAILNDLDENCYLKILIFKKENPCKNGSKWSTVHVHDFTHTQNDLLCMYTTLPISYLLFSLSSTNCDLCLLFEEYEWRQYLQPKMLDFFLIQ